MEDLRQVTIDTYNKSAKGLSEYFASSGARTADVDLAFKLAGSPEKARIVEIGCGDGRDAKVIARRAAWFLGFDVSTELLKIAQRQVPESMFVVADVVSFDFPRDLDIVFAFASLLHLDKREVATVLKNVHESLRPGGICYISLKYAPVYESKVKEDEYGKRLFYFYNPKIIQELAGEGFEVAHTQRETRKVEWFEIALRKV